MCWDTVYTESQAKVIHESASRSVEEAEAYTSAHSTFPPQTNLSEETDEDLKLLLGNTQWLKSVVKSAKIWNRAKDKSKRVKLARIFYDLTRGREIAEMQITLQQKMEWIYGGGVKEEDMDNIIQEGRHVIFQAIHDRLPADYYHVLENCKGWTPRTKDMLRQLKRRENRELDEAEMQASETHLQNLAFKPVGTVKDVREKMGALMWWRQYMLARRVNQGKLELYEWVDKGCGIIREKFKQRQALTLADIQRDSMGEEPIDKTVEPEIQEPERIVTPKVGGLTKIEESENESEEEQDTEETPTLRNKQPTINQIDHVLTTFITESMAAGVCRGDSESYVTVTDPVAYLSAMKKFVEGRKGEGDKGAGKSYKRCTLCMLENEGGRDKFCRHRQRTYEQQDELVRREERLNPNRCLVLAKGILTNPATNKTAETLIELDSGGCDNLINRAYAEYLGLNLEEMEDPPVLSTVNGLSRTKDKAKLYLSMEGAILDHNDQDQYGKQGRISLGIHFIVRDDLNLPLILGSLSMATFGFKIDMERKCCTVGLSSWDFRLRCYGETVMGWQKRSEEPQESYTEHPEQWVIQGGSDGKLYSPEGQWEAKTSQLQNSVNQVGPEVDFEDRNQAESNLPRNEKLTPRERRTLAKAQLPYAPIEPASTEYITQTLIVKEWAMDPPDDVSNPPEEYIPMDTKTSLFDVRRPIQFPVESWRYVSELERPGVKEMWGKYTVDGLTKAIHKVLDIEICNERPEQAKYVLAQCYVNLDAYFDITGIPTHIKGFLYRIFTTDEHAIVSTRVRRFTELEQAYLHAKTGDLLDKKFLQYSTSPSRNPIQLVPYPERIKTFLSTHGEHAARRIWEKEYCEEVCTLFRWTMELRALNEKTIPDRHPLPFCQDVIDRFAGNTNFATFDLKDAFFLIQCHQEDRLKTAFATHVDLLEWLSMPMGAKNAASMWARVIESALKGTNPKEIDKFQDDIVAHTKGIFPLLEAQAEIYRRVRKLGVVIKHTKTALNYTRVRCLGHLVTYGGFRMPHPDLVNKIVDFDEHLKTKDQVARFVGMLMFNREYIPHISELLAPLMDIKSEQGDMNKWRDDLHGEVVRACKRLLISGPILMLPRPDRQCKISVDTASTRSIGAVLLQRRDEDDRKDDDKELRDVRVYKEEEEENQEKEVVKGKDGVRKKVRVQTYDEWFIVAYWSRALDLKSKEAEWTVSLSEAMGMMESIEHFRPYLMGGYSVYRGSGP